MEGTTAAHPDAALQVSQASDAWMLLSGALETDFITCLRVGVQGPLVRVCIFGLRAYNVREKEGGPRP